MPSTAKILVADDSATERKIARETLETVGYEVIQAVDGQHALEMFARERPDLVLLDVVMPRLTGLETCRILKAKAAGSYLPVIMLSTRNSVNARVEGLRSGADDYLGKPYDPEELRARVEALLRARATISEAAHAAADILEQAAENARDDDGRAAFRKRLMQEFERASRYSDPLACLRIEIDAWDAVQRRHGEAGATVIENGVREIIEHSVRKVDVVYRTSEAGYVVLLPNTHFPGALTVAERIAIDVRKRRFELESEREVTVSIGVSFFPNKDTHAAQDLLDLVDAALEHARSEGVGHICLYQHQGYLYVPTA